MGIDAKMLFESKLINIWAEATKLQIPYADRGFRFPTNLVTDSILFVGINPSYNIGVSHKAYYNSFYSLNQQGDNHRYFKKFEDIAKHTANNWTHIDLFFYQETAQKSFYEILQNQYFSFCLNFVFFVLVHVIFMFMCDAWTIEWVSSFITFLLFGHLKVPK